MSVTDWYNNTVEWLCGPSRNRCCLCEKEHQEIDDTSFPPTRDGFREPLQMRNSQIVIAANHPSDPKMVDNTTPMSFDDIVEITPIT